MSIVGVLGDGYIDRKNAYALLDDFHGRDPITALVLPGDADDWSDAVRFTADWGLSHEVGVNLYVVENEQAALTHLTELDITTISEAPDPEAYIIAEATDIFLAWNSEFEDDYYATADHIVDSGKRAYNFVEGLFPLVDEGAPDAPAAEPEAATPEPEPAAPKTRRKATQKPAEPADEAQAEVTTQYPNAPEGLSDADVERICASMAEKIQTQVIPTIIRDVLEGVGELFIGAVRATTGAVDG